MEGDRYAAYGRSLGAPLVEKIKSSRVLMVGAGGIGCELLKDLVLSGFHNIDIIDLDTIDLSNLNRQFLFRNRHIGSAKAHVAKETALQFNADNVKIQSHQDNIMDPKFSVSYFRQYDIVFMALDNVEARRHVNKMCLAAGVPAIESGTAGYLGQVQVIQKGATECYDCKPKERQKTFAVCTINNTPSKPIHCIVWSKWKFRDLFDEAEDVQANDDQDEEDNEKKDKDGETDQDALLHDDQVIKDLEKQLEDLQKESFEKALLFRFFHLDIVKRLHLAAVTKKDIWGGRDPPSPLPLSLILNPPSLDSSNPQANGLKDQQTWTTEQNVSAFLSSAKKLQERKAEKGPIQWDKDDAYALDFVTSATNLRAASFSIPIQTRFDVKAAAGSIIPAIATSNAIVGGLIVLEAYKILDGRLKDCKTTYLMKNPSAKRVFLSSQLEAPQRDCSVCGSNYAVLSVNTEISTLGFVVNNIIKQKLGVPLSSIFVKSTQIYEEFDDMEEDEIKQIQLVQQKKLKDILLTDGALMLVQDTDNNTEINIFVEHDPTKGENEGDLTGTLVLTKSISLPEPEPEVPVASSLSSSSSSSSSSSTGNIDLTDDDDLEIVNEPPQKIQKGTSSSSSSSSSTATILDDDVVEIL